MDPKKISRKKFLLTTFFSSIAIGAGGYLLHASYKVTRLFFGNKSEETIVWFIKAVLPEEEGFPSGEQAEVISRLDEELFFVDSSIGGDFKLAIWVLEFLPIRFGYWLPFSKLNLSEARKFLNEALASDSEIARNIVSSFRMVVMLVYYGHKSTWKQIGYDGPYGNIPEKLSEARIYYKEQVRVK